MHGIFSGFALIYVFWKSKFKYLKDGLMHFIKIETGEKLFYIKLQNYN